MAARKCLTLNVNYRVPSLNTLFAMGHWQRRKVKVAIQDAVLSALLATETENAIPTTFAGSGSSMHSDMLASYMTTDRKTSSTKSRKRKSPTRRKRKR